MMAVTTVAKSQLADVLVIAGDLFDSPKQERHTVLAVARLLQSLDIPCVILAGNHDAGPRGALDQVAEIAANVTVLGDGGGTRVDVLAGELQVWGRGVVDHSPTFHPLQGAPIPQDDTWSVIVGHGHFIGDIERGAADFRSSSPITREDLESIRADYIALGHWHLSKKIFHHPPTWYSGSPMVSGSGQHAIAVRLEVGHAPSVELTPIQAPELGCKHLISQ
jgi:DNA repair exonuclease SbcCD nuclease subunit